MDGLDEVRWRVVSAEPIGPISQPAPVEEWTPQDWALAKLTYLARRRPLTIADLVGVDRTAGRLELIDGVLLMTPNPDADHLRRSRRLANTLDTVVPKGCEAIEGINVFEPGSDRVIFMPDVAVIVSDKLIRVPGQGEGVFPDGLELVIEITSSNRDVDLGTKRQRYGSWGVPYLVVDRATDPSGYLTFGEWPEWAQAILP